VTESERPAVQAPIAQPPAVQRPAARRPAARRPAAGPTIAELAAVERAAAQDASARRLADHLASAPNPDPLLSGVSLAVLRLNGQFLDAAEKLVRPVGLTAAWLQVLGAVLERPLSVAAIARAMGITRQSVQRIADLLVEGELAEYLPNPAHARAKLLEPTEAGRAAVHRIVPAHRKLADLLAAELGLDAFQHTSEVLTRLSQAMAAIEGRSRALGL
jgi:DNA-binding MarR family transcriptional regulator